MYEEAEEEKEDEEETVTLTYGHDWGAMCLFLLGLEICQGGKLSTRPQTDSTGEVTFLSWIGDITGTIDLLIFVLTF